MPAKTFFAMLQQGYRTSCFYRDTFLSEMIDIASTAQADAKWIDSLKAYYKRRIGSYLDLPSIDGSAKPLEKTTLEHQHAVAASLREVFKIKSQLEGYG